MRKSRPIETRFWEKIQKTDNCWIWMGARLKQGGYGTLAVRRGTPAVRAHRFSWELHNGPIPEGINVLHKCDNPPCVRPDHLFLGNQVANMLDCSAKGRNKITVENHVRGNKHPQAKLTDAIVAEIRQQYALRLGSLASLAATFEVSKKTILNVVHKKIWTHV